jgi:hypothetical protein
MLGLLEDVSVLTPAHNQYSQRVHRGSMFRAYAFLPYIQGGPNFEYQLIN